MVIDIEINKGGKMMKLRRIIKKINEAIAIKIAVRDADFACPCLTYQPKLPEAVKKEKNK